MNAADDDAQPLEAGYLEPLQSMGYLCRVNFRLFSRLLEARIAAHGVSSGQWRSLRVLWEEDGLTQRELSLRVGNSEATTVAILRTLERNRFILRKQDLQDRRKTRIHLTPKARRLRAKLLPFVNEVNDLACHGVPPEDLEVARRVLVQMYQNLSEARRVAQDPAPETALPPAG